MAGPLLRTGKLDEHKPLGQEGNPVYRSARQLREAVRLQLGAEVASYLAHPQANEAGDTVDWYASEGGLVVPWSSASLDERNAAYEDLKAAREKLAVLSASMKQQDHRERQTFGRLLEDVIRFPDPAYVYIVNGRPVITFWGFDDPIVPGADSVERLRPRPEPPPVAAPIVAASIIEPAPLPPPAPPPPPPQKRWCRRQPRWLCWLWWLLLLLLLLALLLFLLRACKPELATELGVPDLGLPDAGLVLPESGLPVLPDGVDGAGVVGDGGIDAGLPELPVDGAIPDEDLGSDPDALPDALPQPDPDAPETTPPEPGTDPGKDPEQLPPRGQEPGAPLTIPESAQKDGKLDFLDGKWRATTGLQDARTGQPLDLEYEFEKGTGKGKVNIQMADGSRCTGEVTAAMSDGGLKLSDQSPILCPDGTGFRPAQVACKVGAKGVADCSGDYGGGETFAVGMERAAPKPLPVPAARPAGAP